MKKLALVCTVLFTTTSAFAQGSTVDWKLYGGGSGDVDTACFFHANGIVRRTDGYIRAWTKCLSLKDLQRIDLKKDYGRKISENAARKKANNYVPPLALVESIDKDVLIGLMYLEEVANIATIEPNSRV